MIPEDADIVELYWKRDETAIAETERKYSRYLTVIADNILFSREDSAECVNDTYLRAWNSMPPQKPAALAAYLAKLTRQGAIDRWRRRHSKRRSAGTGGEYAGTLAELSECVPSGERAHQPEQAAEDRTLAQQLDAWLREQSPEVRRAFLCRYCFSDPIRDIAVYLGASEAKVKSMLFRARKDLRAYLERGGFSV